VLTFFWPKFTRGRILTVCPVKLFHIPREEEDEEEEEEDEEALGPPDPGRPAQMSEKRPSKCLLTAEHLC